MRQLTATLGAAQKQPSRIPCVSVRAVNKAGGAVRLDWTRLYTGAELEYFHGLAVPGDGSLVRVRITPVSDSRKLYRQRVANPGPGSDFSQWTYLTQYDIAAAAAAANGAEVSIIWIKSNREIRRIKSTDNGATWGSPELIDYAASTSVYGAAAAYKPNGDLALFFADQSTLYVKKCIGGQWQTKAAWNKTTGALSGVGALYDDDWCLLVTGKDTVGNYKLWSLVYGDGGGVSAGTWSALKEIASAPAGGNFSYKQPFLDKAAAVADVCRCFYIEEYTGSEACSRPYQSYTIPGTPFCDGIWREPAPFDLSSQYGLAMAHFGEYNWLSSPNSVWRAALNVQTLDISADIISLQQEQDKSKGNLAVELNNSDGRYSSPGQGALSVLKRGCQLEFSPGYITPEGEEYSAGQHYSLEAFEHISGRGKAVLALHAQDGWRSLNRWRARHQFRWNKSADEASVKDIITVVLGRVGLRLAVITQSAAVTAFYPDFTVNPENRGDEVIGKLLSFVPDRIFIEGNTAYMVNPLAGDSAVYQYGTGHPVLEGRYLEGTPALNHAQVEGWDTTGGTKIIKDSFTWSEIECLEERLGHVSDRNLNTVAEAEQRGQALLRQSELEADECSILVPVNCGQQLYDVIEVTDAPAGLNAAKKRVTGLALAYDLRRGEYAQRLKLGRV
jgi:hypothetical protein